MINYQPVVIEAKYQPVVIDVTQESVAIEAYYNPVSIDVNQSDLIIEYQVNEQFQRIPILTTGQTVFNLNNSPAVPENVKVYLVPDGVFISGVHYSISGATLTFLPSFPVTLEVSEYLDIYYY